MCSLNALRRVGGNPKVTSTNGHLLNVSNHNRYRPSSRAIVRPTIPSRRALTYPEQTHHNRQLLATVDVRENSKFYLASRSQTVKLLPSSLSLQHRPPGNRAGGNRGFSRLQWRCGPWEPYRSLGGVYQNPPISLFVDCIP